MSRNITRIGALGPADPRLVSTAPPSAGPWEEIGGTVKTDNTTWNVVVGAAAMSGGEKFRVRGTAQHDLGVANQFFQTLTQDAYSRYQLWMTMPNSVLRLGADTADGDAFQASTEGIVLYNPTTNNMNRQKPDRIGLTRCTDSSLYFLRGDETSFYYRADPPGGAYHFFVNRATGFVGMGANAPVGGETLRVVGGARIEGASRINGKLTVTGIIDPTGMVLDEQSTVPGGAPGAAKGTFWVKDDAPNKPYFTDDDGTDHDLLSASAGPWKEASGDVSPDNAAWQVIIGGAAAASSEILRVIGRQLSEGDQWWGTDASPKTKMYQANGQLVLGGGLAPDLVGSELLRARGPVRIEGSADPILLVSTGGVAEYLRIRSSGLEEIRVGNNVDNGGAGPIFWFLQDEVRWDAPTGANPVIIGPKIANQALMPGRAVNFYSGAGGSGGTGGGGVGGALNLYAGPGGDEGSVGPTGIGGAASLRGGHAGPVTGAGGGGSIGGAALVDGGNGSGGFAAGEVKIGTNAAGKITLGNAVDNPNMDLLGSGYVNIPAGQFIVGAAAPVGAEKLRVVGAARIEGKLTVTGLIDPTGMVLDEQATVPGGAPAAGKGCFWVKNDSPNRPYFTDDSGSDYDLLSASAGPWTEALGRVYPDNLAWQVLIGVSSPYASERLRVSGTTSLNGNIDFEPNSQRNITILKAAAETNGFRLEVYAGEGGDSAGSNGKTGGSALYRAGLGGWTTNPGSNGGLGGVVDVWGGEGGRATAGGGVGGAGGAAHFYGGNGGRGTGASDDGGVGGQASIQGGAGGISVSGTPGIGGDVFCRGGGGGTVKGGDFIARGGLGTPDGDVKIGDLRTNSIQLGNASDNPPTDWYGSGLITVNSLARIDPSDGGAIWGALARHGSALLQADSTTKGFLPPRMTQAQRDAIVGPATGLEVVNTTTSPSLDYHDGTRWRQCAPPVDAGLKVGPTAYAAVIDDVIRCNPSGGIPTITLPTAVGAAMRAITIKEVAGSANPINVNTTGGQTIDGVAGPPADTIAAAYGAATYISDGSNWMKFT